MGVVVSKEALLRSSPARGLFLGVEPSSLGEAGCIGEAAPGSSMMIEPPSEAVTKEVSEV